MRSKLEPRIFRIWLSSLMNSDFTPAELRKVAEQLTRSPELFWEFGDLLRTVVDRIDERPQHGSREEIDQNDLAERFYSLIKSRRMPKRMVFDLLIIATDHKMSLDDSTSIREALYRFFTQASRTEIDRFTSLIDNGDSDQDAYLKGITNRK